MPKRSASANRWDPPELNAETLESLIEEWLERREKDPRIWKSPGTLAFHLNSLLQRHMRISKTFSQP